jgi:hypothetical protein
MAADLAEQLQTSLGSSYTIVHELGGGGMSRVFLADDKALQRFVVIKVLHPELAAGVTPSDSSARCSCLRGCSIRTSFPSLLRAR